MSTKCEIPGILIVSTPFADELVGALWPCWCSHVCMFKKVITHRAYGVSLSPLQIYCITVLMNQWQRTSQFIHWCEGLNVWNRKKQQTPMKDKKGSGAGVLVRFCGWRLSSCWFLILSCLFFLGTLNCRLLCWGKFSISFHFIVSFALSGTTLASHLLLHHPPGPTGKVPWVCVVDVTTHPTITPTVVQQWGLFLCHQAKVSSLSPGKVKLSSPSGNHLFISVWLILLESVFTLTRPLLCLSQPV